METQLEYEITISHKENYIHVHVEGLGSSEGAMDLWQQIAQACERYQCYNILGEQNLHSTVSTLDALNYPAMFKKLGITKKHRIAWVDNNPRTRETTEFIRDVLANRLMGHGRIFSDTERAKHWLLKSH